MVTKIRNAQLGFESRAIQDVGAEARMNRNRIN
jgi:hypothetical protein